MYKFCDWNLVQAVDQADIGPAVLLKLTSKIKPSLVNRIKSSSLFCTRELIYCKLMLIIIAPYTY